MGLFKRINNILNANKAPAGKQFRSAVERDMYINNTMGYRRVKDKLDYHDDLYKRIGAIHQKYNDKSDISAYIAALENIISTDPESEASVWNTLLNLYVSEKNYDKAWGFTNKLCLNNAIPRNKIRREQFRILKKEKRYISALDMLMGAYLLSYSNQTSFNRNAFIKEAGACTRALKWGEDVLNDMADILAEQLKNKDYDESKLHGILSNYLKSKGLLPGEKL